MKPLPALRRMQRATGQLAKAKINRRRVKAWRGQAFSLFHQVRGFPHLRVDISAALRNDRLLLNCRLLDPDAQACAIGIRYCDGSEQWICEDLVHYRTSPTSLSRMVLAPGQPDRFCGLISCDQSPYNISSVRLRLKNNRTVNQSVKIKGSASDPLSLIIQLMELTPRDPSEKRRAYDCALGRIIGEIWSSRPPRQKDRHYRRVDFNSQGAEVHSNDMKAWASSPAKADQHSFADSDSPRRKGERISPPDVSLIIPIYGRYDFIEYQLAMFANDDYLSRQEIIYVIDDPRIQDQVLESCDSLARLYLLPFSVLLLEGNHGFAAANNIGVEFASAPHVLLLNSDVFPDRARWLESLLGRQSGVDLSNAIVGARLKYHDESIQHDGMVFFKSPFAGGLWINLHPGKGMPADQFSCSEHPQQRECLTGACLLLSKDNYQSLGGLDENYILGDFEDSDLCMKARQKGLQVLLNEDVSLYHLERQSQSLVSDKRWKTELTYYNCWYHTDKWHEQILQLKQEQADDLRH